MPCPEPNTETDTVVDGQWRLCHARRAHDPHKRQAIIKLVNAISTRLASVLTLVNVNADKARDTRLNTSRNFRTDVRRVYSVIMGRLSQGSAMTNVSYSLRTGPPWGQHAMNYFTLPHLEWASSLQQTQPVMASVTQRAHRPAGSASGLHSSAQVGLLAQAQGMCQGNMRAMCLGCQAGERGGNSAPCRH